MAEWEAKAVAALKWLDGERRRRVVDDVLVVANHPLRLGIDSPHEMRAWRDAAPDRVVSPGTGWPTFPLWAIIGTLES